MRDDMNDVVDRSTDRRRFLGMMTAAGVGMMFSDALAGNGLTPPPVPKPQPGPGGVPTDQAQQFAGVPGSGNIQILNFALTLEILEADLYRQALNLASGKAINTPLKPFSQAGSYQRTVGGGGLTTTLTNVGYLYLLQFAYVEEAHRKFLNDAIIQNGGTPTTRNANGYKFPTPPSANIASILGQLLPLEETGVRAYLGALPYLTSLPLAVVAGGIFSTEARHSAAVAYALNIDAGPRKMNGDLAVTAGQPSENTFEYYLKPKTVLQVASVYFA